MDKNKKKVLIIISVILVFIILLAILLSILLKDDDNSSNANQGDIKENIKTEITILKDDTTFFTIQKYINNYYELLTNKDTDSLMDILDPDYIAIKNINTSNLYKIIYSDYEEVTFVPKKVYYNPGSTLTYYFIEGYIINIPFLDEEVSYNDMIDFILIVDESTKNYKIVPLERVNIENYAKTYEIENRTITSNALFTKTSISEKSKLSLYITDFLNLCLYDPNKAYNMLSNESKAKYLNANALKEQIMLNYDIYTSSIFSYQKEKKNAYIEYNIKDDNQNKIIIYEYTPMDYKIDF